MVDYETLPDVAGLDGHVPNIHEFRYLEALHYLAECDTPRRQPSAKIIQEIISKVPWCVCTSYRGGLYFPVQFTDEVRQ